MKKLFLQVTLGLVVMFNIAGCSTKINTAAPYQNVTMTYSLLDMGDTAHYIRIQKAFLDDTKSAYDMAKVADSSFYLNLDVTVKEIDAFGSLHNTFTLTKVNMTDEGYPKDTGLFFTNPSYAYKFKQAISSAYKYRLMIHNPQSGETDSAQTIVFNEDKVPGGFKVPTYDQASIVPIVINQSPYALFTVQVNPPDSTLTLQGIIRFHWVDKNISTGVETDRSYDWNFATNILSAPAARISSNLQCNAADFITVLKSALGTAPAGVQRYLDSTDIFLYAGPAILYNYELVAQQSGLGITGSSIQPIFSNISGKYSYGIFTTTGKWSKLNQPFEGASLTYILDNPLLQGSGLVGVSDH